MNELHVSVALSKYRSTAFLITRFLSQHIQLVKVLSDLATRNAHKLNFKNRKPYVMNYM